MLTTTILINILIIKLKLTYKNSIMNKLLQITLSGLALASFSYGVTASFTSATLGSGGDIANATLTGAGFSVNDFNGETGFDFTISASQSGVYVSTLIFSAINGDFRSTSDEAPASNSLVFDFSGLDSSITINSITIVPYNQLRNLPSQNQLESLQFTATGGATFSFTDTSTNGDIAVSGVGTSSLSLTGGPTETGNDWGTAVATGSISDLTLFWEVTETGNTTINNFNAYRISVDYTVVPEPSTYAAILGFVGLAFAIIKRRRK